MKRKFSVSWKSSRSVRKKRKYKANAPLHLKHKMITCSLSKELRKKHLIKRIPLRKGDTVKIMRGNFKGKTGKVTEVNLKKMAVTIEKIQNQKKDGTKINAYFNPSNLQIQVLITEDRKRIKQKPEKKENKDKENKKNAPEKK